MVGIFTVICHRDDMNFSFTVTSSPEYLCLGDSVQLICSAQGSATWRSDNILGPGRVIFLTISNLTNSTETVGNGTGVLLKKNLYNIIVTSLLFNLTTDRVEASCTDNQLRTTTTISSVQPSEFQINFSIVV